MVAAYNSIDNENADFVCDGTNDHVEIQQAIDNLPSGGGSVYLREGIYDIGATITLNNNVALIGAGAGTWLYLANNVDDDVIYGTGLDNLLVADLRIYGNGANNTGGHGIYILNAWKFRIEDVWVENCDKDGINLTFCWYSTVSNSILDGNGQYGITVAGASQNVNVVGNVCTGNVVGGLYLEALYWSTVSGNTTEGNLWGIVAWAGSESNAITGNTVVGNSEHGIYGHNSKYNTITGNVISSNGGHGIYLLSDCDHNTISGNAIDSNSQDTNNVDNGIQIKTSNYNNIQGNTVRRGAGAKKQNTGIMVLSGTNNLVVNNDCYDGGTTNGIDNAVFIETGAGNRNNDGTWSTTPN